MCRPTAEIRSIKYARTYEYLGAHPQGNDRVFRVWAPNARAVSLVGDFCSWDTGLAMERIGEDGIWQIIVRGSSVTAGDKYKYKLLGENGWCYKSDPYAFACECASAAASVISDIENYEWHDSAWKSFLQKSKAYTDDSALNIYGVRPNVWERMRGTEQLPHSELACYVKQMGYTHVLLEDAQENRREGCCRGVCSLLASSSSYGTPENIASFVDAMHEAGIGVIFDISFDIFPLNEGSLLRFDGRPLYERADMCTPTADLDQEQVRELVLSTLTFWIEKYHADGLYIKGLDALMRPTDSTAKYRKAREFVEQALRLIKQTYAGILAIAECKDTSSDIATLAGIDAVCGVGRADHTLSDTGKDPYQAKRISTVSYDRADILNFSELRALIGYKTVLAGKRLTPMGAEFGSPFTADTEGRLEWELLDSHPNALLQKYVAELNHLCLSKKALNSKDVKTDECAENVMSLIHSGGECISLINLTHGSVRVSLADKLTEGEYVRIFNSDDAAYGGSDALIGCTNVAPANCLNAPAYSFSVYERVAK